MEILTLWELQSASVLVEQDASKLLFIAYAIAWFITKEGRYSAAFLFDEILSNISLLDFLSEPQYYLMITLIYCSLYWYIELKNIRLKTIIACGIIVFFNAGMSVDAYFNPEVETIIYKSYIYIIVILHLYLISTLFSRAFIGRCMEDCIRIIGRASGTSDAFTFFWYNSIISKN